MFMAVRSRTLDPLKTFLISVPTLILVVCLVACGGGAGGMTLHAGTPTAIAFQSYRALDGSDAINTDQPDGLTPVANIWTINSDGTGLTPITQLSGGAYGADSTDPQWSPDGTKIIYSSGRALDGSDNPSVGSAINIWVSNADGSGATPLTQMTVYAPCYGVAWSPDGTKIAYFSWRGLDGSNTNAGTSDTHNIWVMNADGSNNIPITQLSAAGTDSYYPRWSPDGSKLTYYSGRALDGSDAPNGQEFTQNIWIMNADGSGSVPVTQLTGVLSGNQDAYWSKDGSTLVFAGGDGNIYTVQADGSGLTQLTTGNALNIPEGWSPDGTKIVFESSLSVGGGDSSQESLNIWVMNDDGSNPTPLTKLTAAGAVSGAWSSDGTRIAYMSDRSFDGSDNPEANPQTNNLWLMQADGSGSVPLTKLTKADSEGPAWKP
jgi:Tol biopolymer transport system component